MATMKALVPLASGCTKREHAVLATAVKEMEVRGKNPMETLAVIQVEFCHH